MDTNILYKKSEENLKAAEKCVDESYYYAALSRLYYSIFQKIKYCIMTGKEDYYKYYKQHLGEKKIRTSTGEEVKKRRKEFEHFGIAIDLKNFLYKNFDKKFDKKKLYEYILMIDQIRDLRIVADYNPENISIDSCEKIKDLKTFVKTKIYLVQNIIKYIDSIIEQEEDESDVN